ncbi:MAG: SDR family oxidoreductase [Planctomycetes bacterium]|nr:SDR family oxidoreductase [Planctomycetota bacterium]
MSYRPIVLITGASSGIGAAVARLLADSCRLILVARREDRLRELQKELGQDSVAVIVCDLSDRTQRDALIEKSSACYSGLDVVINNAGIFIATPHSRLKDKQLDQMWEINVTAPLMLTRKALPALRESSCGHIINISSSAADASFANCGAYSASKAAIEAWSRSLREELRPYEIRVSIVVPGATKTEIWPEDSDFPEDKMSTAEDVARAMKCIIEMPKTTSVDRLVVNPSGGAL